MSDGVKFILLGLTATVCILNLYIYTTHMDMNWCEAEVDVLRLSVDKLIQLHGVDLGE